MSRRESDELAPGGLVQAEVLTPEGERVRLADTWSTRPAVLALVRHFG
jgi:hypothetical protein